MKSVLSLGALVVFGLAATLHAESIGINFVGKDAKAQTLEAAQSAGVVAQDHWNNMTATADDPNGHGNEGRLVKVMDSTGKEIAGASVTVSAKADTQIWPNNGASWGFADSNLVLQSGLIGPQPTISIKGIPYKEYDVYVYAAAGENGGQGSAKITANKDSGKVDSNTYFVNFNWQEGNYVKSEAKTLDEAKKSKGSNYVCFTGNTASDITIDFNGKAGGGWISVAGVQIVGK